MKVVPAGEDSIWLQESPVVLWDIRWIRIISSYAMKLWTALGVSLCQMSSREPRLLVEPNCTQAIVGGHGSTFSLHTGRTCDTAANLSIHNSSCYQPIIRPTCAQRRQIITEESVHWLSCDVRRNEGPSLSPIGDGTVQHVLFFVRSPAPNQSKRHTRRYPRLFHRLQY